MTPSGAKQLTVVALVTAAGLASVRSIAAGHAPPLRVGIGAGLAGVVLFALADPAPALAGGFAGLLLVTALFTNGTQVYSLLGKAVGK